ncbi:hypothetical protein PQX77_013526 [Marasmius sp. AFHP31]|nr:hypothetical protein PQX77_013526 [Marasmius sp. AFHP31]
MPFLPLELVIIVLRELGDAKYALCRASLVCRSWLPVARSLLFRHIRIQPLGLECQLVLGLCESPLETFSLARAHELSIDSRHHTVVPPTPHPTDLNCLLNWRSSDGQRTLTTVLKHVSDLKLSGLRWWTLDTCAKRAMLDGFRFVTKLHLSRLLFDVFDTPTSNATDDFVALLNSFPALEALDIESIHLPLNSAQHEHRQVPTKLRSISLKEVGGSSRVMECLAPCPNVEVLAFTNLRPRHWFLLTLEWAIALAGILNSAGESLKELTLAIPPGPVDPQASPALDLFLELLNTSATPNLEHINLSTDDPLFTLSFLQRLAASYDRFKGASLRLLSIPPLASLPQIPDQFDFGQLDRLLQHPVFAKVHELRFQIHAHAYGELIYMLDPNERGQGADSLFEMMIQRKISEFRRLMPLCDERGILRAEVVFC